MIVLPTVWLSVVTMATENFPTDDNNVPSMGIFSERSEEDIKVKIYRDLIYPCRSLNEYETIERCAGTSNKVMQLDKCTAALQLCITALNWSINHKLASIFVKET